MGGVLCLEYMLRAFIDCVSAVCDPEDRGAGILDPAGKERERERVKCWARVKVNIFRQRISSVSSTLFLSPAITSEFTSHQSTHFCFSYSIVLPLSSVTPSPAHFPRPHLHWEKWESWVTEVAQLRCPLWS